MPAPATDFRERLITHGCNEGLADVLLDMVAARDHQQNGTAELIDAKLAEHEQRHEGPILAAINDLSETANEAERRNEQRFAEVKSEIADLRETVSDLRETVSEAERRSEQRSAEIEKSISRLREENERRLAAVHLEIAESRAENERAISELRTENERRFAEASTENERRFSGVEQSLSRLREENERRFSELRSANERALAELRTENERALSEVRSEISESRNDTANLGAKMTDRILYVGLGLAGLLLGTTGAIIGAVAALR